MPSSLCSFCAPHLTPRFQAWEIEPNGTWKVKWDPATHSEPSLSSSQNLAEPQSFTWFWVKTTPNHLFFKIHGFSLKMRFHAKSAPVSEVFLGRARAHLELMWTVLPRHLRSASNRGCPWVCLKAQGLSNLAYAMLSHGWKTSRMKKKTRGALISSGLCSWIFQPTATTKENKTKKIGRWWTRTGGELGLKKFHTHQDAKEKCEIIPGVSPGWDPRSSESLR